MKALILIAALVGSASAFGACRDGDKASFLESNGINDRTVTVVRTCVNGSYYDLSGYVRNPKSKCNEGDQAWFTEPTANDRSKTVLRTCVKGSYYDLGNYIRKPKSKCREGATYTENGGGVNDHGTVTKVCRGGKYVTAN